MLYITIFCFRKNNVILKEKNKKKSRKKKTSNSLQLHFFSSKKLNSKKIVYEILLFGNVSKNVEENGRKQKEIEGKNSKNTFF